MPAWTLSSHLLASDENLFRRATESPFLLAAASGTLSKPTISRWLANDRLYMQGYIRLAGNLLRLLSLPAKPTGSKEPGTIEVRLLDWLVGALANIRREERFFMDVAERYELDVDITEVDGRTVKAASKNEGLRKFEHLFGEFSDEPPTNRRILPWLEGVVLFWATEKAYFEAWSKARRSVPDVASGNEEDGGAMRKEFIPNWTNDEFIKFVEALQSVLDDGVQEAIGSDENMRADIISRAEAVWIRVLEAEASFWPET